jgi:hypothetical protein
MKITQERMSSSVKKRIGILAYRGVKGFTEPVFLRRLVRAGQKLGAEVFVFSTQDVYPNTRKIRGFIPEKDRWESNWYSWPDIVIDRYRYYPIPKYRAYQPFRRQNLFRYANSRFADKFHVHHVLAEDSKFLRWLPETHPFSEEKLKEMLRRHKIVYLKPTNGTGGRSILRMERTGGSYLLHGQTKRRGRSSSVMPTWAALVKRIRQWIHREKRGEETFFLQQGLDLELMPQRVVDIRLLIQKDGDGLWKITGAGARIGQVNASTSNLHAGGIAVRASQLLAFRFGQERARSILAECRELAYCAVEKIEQQYGSMIEFGFDIGIDVNGRVWLIEMNPKPGREIFRMLGLQEQYQLAVRRPIEYALYLLRQEERQPGEDLPALTPAATMASSGEDSHYPTLEESAREN